MKFQILLTFDTLEEANNLLQKLGLAQNQVQTVSQPAQQQPQSQQYNQQPLPGQPMPGQQQFGQQPMPGQPMPGQQQFGQQPMPGQPMPGQQQFGQQPLPGQPMPGQQQFGQQPGQPMPGQFGPQNVVPTIEMIGDLARTAASKNRSSELMALCNEFSIPKLTDCPEATRPMLYQRLLQLAN